MNWFMDCNVVMMKIILNSGSEAHVNHRAVHRALRELEQSGPAMGQLDCDVNFTDKHDFPLPVSDWECFNNLESRLANKEFYRDFVSIFLLNSILITPLKLFSIVLFVSEKESH